MTAAGVRGGRERGGAMIHVSSQVVFLTFGMNLPLFQFRSFIRPCKHQLDPPRGSDLPPVPLFLRFLFNDRR